MLETGKRRASRFGRRQLAAMYARSLTLADDADDDIAEPEVIPVCHNRAGDEFIELESPGIWDNYSGLDELAPWGYAASLRALGVPRKFKPERTLPKRFYEPQYVRDERARVKAEAEATRANLEKRRVAAELDAEAEAKARISAAVIQGSYARILVFLPDNSTVEVEYNFNKAERYRQAFLNDTARHSWVLIEAH